jgi:hypothetical protein
MRILEIRKSFHAQKKESRSKEEEYTPTSRTEKIVGYQLWLVSFDSGFSDSLYNLYDLFFVLFHVDKSKFGDISGTLQRISRRKGPEAVISSPTVENRVKNNDQENMNHTS